MGFFSTGEKKWIFNKDNKLFWKGMPKSCAIIEKTVLKPFLVFR